MTHLPLSGRAALVTGVSRRRGIGFAAAGRLAGLGTDLFLQSWVAHDAAQPWGADPIGPEAVAEELRSKTNARVAHLEADLAEADAPDQLLWAACEAYGHVDVLVANHARSGAGDIGSLTAEEIDVQLAVNVRATLLLVQSFARQHDGRAGGRVVLLTSGQHQGPMPGELDYVAAKGALHQLTLSLAHALIRRGIVLNTVNPGPTDTGWATAAQREAVAARHPQRRWGTPDDAARLIAWLCTDDADWIVGQVINSDGGFGLTAAE